MAAKLLHSLTDDNLDLQNQIGCMTGFFQIFDRQQILTGRRIGQRRLVSGNSHFDNASLVTESNNYNQHNFVESRPNKWVNEKPRVSSEPLAVSFSSSSCSSSSLRGCSVMSPPASSSFDHISFPESPSMGPALSRPSSSAQQGRQSLDLRDVVKDSMYKEARGLSVKTASREEPTDHVMKHRDSPRPLAMTRRMDFSYRMPNMPVNSQESLRVLAKLQESSSNYNDVRELRGASCEVKGAPLHSISKDAHRFSCDGREINRFSFDSRDHMKCNSRLNEQPRLSLDGRESSMQAKANSLSRSSERSSVNSDDKVLDKKTTGTQKRPPSVVAKLMGLEALPNSPLARDHQMGVFKSSPAEDHDGFLVPSKRHDPIQFPNSPRNSRKDPVSPRWKSPDSGMKPVPSVWVPIEPAPWSKMDCNSPRQQFNHAKAPARRPNSYPSVYSEIEKRLKDLEHQQPGKDIRALKQILEAMHERLLVQTSEEEEYSKFRSERGHYTGNQSHRQTSQRKLQNDGKGASTIRGTSYTRTSESPIVIMKPAKLIKKSGIPASSMIPVDDLPGFRKRQEGESAERRALASCQRRKDQNPKTSRSESVVSSSESVVSSSEKKANAKISRPLQSPTRVQKLPRENSRGAIRNSDSTSPRLQHKKIEMDKRSRPTNPSSDLVKSRRKSNRQSPESGSTGRKLGSKSTKLLQSDDQLSEVSFESRNLSIQGDDCSVQSDSNITLDLPKDIEFTEAERSEVTGSQIQSMKSTMYLVSSFDQENLNPRYNENSSLEDVALPFPEHYSPVSVLDGVVDRDGTPSPVKQMALLFEDDGPGKINGTYNDEQPNTKESFPCENVGSGINSAMSRRKLQNVENLVQKLRRLNSSHDEARTDYIASLCENTNPDHRYISEILLASGLLLRDLGSGLSTFKFHPSGYPINPELYLVLEQTKVTPPISDKPSLGNVPQPKRNLEKFHRKLIFDTVNEILVEKLASVMPSSEPCYGPDRPSRKSLSAQKLLKELCLDIEQLQLKSVSCLGHQDDGLKDILWEDVLCRSDENWTQFSGENPTVVLDVERSIFKDLVDEVLIGETAKARRNYRQLCAV